MSNNVNTWVSSIGVKWIDIAYYLLRFQEIKTKKQKNKTKKIKMLKNRIEMVSYDSTSTDAFVMEVFSCNERERYRDESLLASQVRESGWIIGMKHCASTPVFHAPLTENHKINIPASLQHFSKHRSGFLLGALHK
jgi:hypothetical protein